MYMHHLKKIVASHNSGKSIGLYSVCSSSPLVIRAAMKDAVMYKYPLIVESTANQVNQFGGYTGMLPTDFVKLIKTIAAEEGLSLEDLIIGGDHLGPLVWTDKPEEEAMKLASQLISAYVMAGYSKIHIDTSMKVADDPEGGLDPSVCAKRGAVLANVVKESFAEYKKKFPDAIEPVFIVGSEVPTPGGSLEFEDSLTPTRAADFLSQVSIFRDTFTKAGLDFTQVVAFVVQPGVEFGDDFVFQYDRSKAKALVDSLKTVQGLVFEGHSTDYQTLSSLQQMVEDGVGIVKVGPAFTFRLREALFLLEEIENILVRNANKRSNFKNTLLAVMNSDPKYWKDYYKGSEEEVAFKKLYSYSDRCRYYLPNPSVQSSMDILLSNLGSIPEVLISQYFPLQYTRFMDKLIEDDAMSIAIDYVQCACHEYAVASGLCEKN